MQCHVSKKWFNLHKSQTLDMLVKFCMGLYNAVCIQLVSVVLSSTQYAGH